MAEFRNLQERMKREMQSAQLFAIQRFAKDLLESIDNLDRALAMVPPERLARKADDDNGDNIESGGGSNSDGSSGSSSSAAAARDLANLYDGLRMTETILLQTLRKHGVERFDPAEHGDRFDPNRHEAIFQAPVPGKEDGVVFHTQQKGYMLNGRVLRVCLLLSLLTHSLPLFFFFFPSPLPYSLIFFFFFSAVGSRAFLQEKKIYKI